MRQVTPVTCVGVDVDSRSIAIARVDLSSAAATHPMRIKVPAKITERAAILAYLREELAGNADWFSDATVCVEAPIVAGKRNLQSTIKIAGVYGVTLSVVGQWAPVVEVAVDSWKKATVGKGGVNKTVVTAWLRETHPLLYSGCFTTSGSLDQNLVDATCIALYGEQLPGDVLTGATAA